jgi:hypothetical protein
MEIRCLLDFPPHPTRNSKSKLGACSERRCSRSGLTECANSDYLETIRRLYPEIARNPPVTLPAR